MEVAAAFLAGKTVERIDYGSEHDFMVMHFTDGSSLLLTAVPWNCGGARLTHCVSFGHHKPKREEPKA